MTTEQAMDDLYDEVQGLKGKLEAEQRAHKRTHDLLYKVRTEYNLYRTFVAQTLKAVPHD